MPDEDATGRLYRAFLTAPGKSWSQRELARAAGCSPTLVSRTVSRLQEAGALARPYRNRVVLTGPFSLLLRWAVRHRLPRPVYVRTDLTTEGVERELARSGVAAVTLFRGAWHRIRELEARVVESYVSAPAIDSLARRLGRITHRPSTAGAVLLPSHGPELVSGDIVDGVPLVAVAQNCVDLLAIGGQGPRAAVELARRTWILGEIADGSATPPRPRDLPAEV